MASPSGTGGSGLLQGTRTRSYGSLVQSPYSPARIRKVEHLVEPGDTLQGLAVKYGVTMEQIKRVNRLYTNDSIFLKKYLSIPVLAEPPELSSGAADTAVASKTGEGTITCQADKEQKSNTHRSASQANHMVEDSARDFMTKLDTRIRVSKRVAVKKIREVDSLAAEEYTASSAVEGYQNPHAGQSQESSPQTQQRSLLGPISLTITTRASAIRDHEDEIFKL